MFNISTVSDKPIYEQIIDNIKELTLKGILKPEDKLPSVRDMASMLSVNPNTVSKAYQELERQKITYTQRGRGTFINFNTNKNMDKERIDKAIEGLRDICIELGHLGFNKKMVIAELDKIYSDIKRGEQND